MKTLKELQSDLATEESDYAYELDNAPNRALGQWFIDDACRQAIQKGKEIAEMLAGKTPQEIEKDYDDLEQALEHESERALTNYSDIKVSPSGLIHAAALFYYQELQEAFKNA